MNINYCYLILNILFVMVGIFYIKNKGLTLKQELCLLGIYLLFTLISFSYMNGIVNSIFHLKFLNTKAYLFLLIIINIIMLFTINHPIKFGYKALNYLLFVIIMIIFGATLSVVLGNKFNSFYIMDIQNAVNFIDLSFVAFIIYLISMSIMYIGYQLFSDEDIKTKIFTSPKRKIFKKKDEDEYIPDDFFSDDSYKDENTKMILTPEQLLSYRDKGLYINGVNVSIIFEDSNKENIVKNYYILNEDIHAKLMNGYTLEENQMLKDICMKLQVGNLTGIDLNNVSILNRINIDEYNLLKKVFGIN